MSVNSDLCKPEIAHYQLAEGTRSFADLELDRRAFLSHQEDTESSLCVCICMQDTKILQQSCGLGSPGLTQIRNALT